MKEGGGTLGSDVKYIKFLNMFLSSTPLLHETERQLVWARFTLKRCVAWTMRTLLI